MLDRKWVRGRSPKPEDCDGDGKILARGSNGHLNMLTLRYEIPEHFVTAWQFEEEKNLVEWAHTDNWLVSHEEIDREIDQIVGSENGSILALAKDGTLWRSTGPHDGIGWEQLPPLPKSFRKLT